MFIVRRTKHYVSILGTVLALVVILSPAAKADLFTWSGLSGVGHPISLEAELTITEGGVTDTLTVTLRNTTEFTYAYAQVPNDVLSSFYFDILDDATGLVRPTLVNSSAVGDVYINDVWQADGVAIRSTEDIPKGGWDFHPTNPATFPYLGFGIGTVGNNTPPNLITDTANQFNGNIVGNINYSIYSDATTDNPLSSGQILTSPLVKGEAIFTFTGDLNGFHIGPDVGFGLGTGPDSFVHVPVPGAVLLGILGLGAVGIKLRKYA